MKCTKCKGEFNHGHTRDVDTDGMPLEDARYYCDDCVLDVYTDGATPEFFDAYLAVYGKAHKLDSR